MGMVMMMMMMMMMMTNKPVFVDYD